MRLAVSNIAWPPAKVDEALDLLAAYGATGLEIAPSLLFAGEDDPLRPSQARLNRALEMVESRGLSFVSLQSLHYGCKDAALFGTSAERRRFVAALEGATELAARLGARTLVVGSPRHRIVPPQLPHEDALIIAVECFRDLGETAAARGCVLAVEANPAAYGTNFLTHLNDAVAFVEQVDHPAITVNLDIGAQILNGEIENVAATVAAIRPRISHVHLSTPHLGPVSGDDRFIQQALVGLQSARWDGWVSIEMRADPGDPLGALQRTLAGVAPLLAEATDET
jgi:sugar phosphate isomerase/epimerase